MAAIANIHDAKTNLSKLIERALAGEDVTIARAGKPLVRLVPVQSEQDRVDHSQWLGALKGQVWVAPDFDEADAEVEAMFEKGLDKP
jgi:prevent-host-death family protein